MIVKRQRFGVLHGAHTGMLVGIDHERAADPERARWAFLGICRADQAKPEWRMLQRCCACPVSFGQAGSIALSWTVCTPIRTSRVLQSESIAHPSTSGDCCAARFQFGLRSRLNAVGTATRRRRPYSGGSVRPRVIRDGTLRAWFRAYSGRAGFHAHLNGYSQPLAERVVLVPKASHSLQCALFKEGSVPLSHGAPQKNVSVT